MRRQIIAVLMLVGSLVAAEAQKPAPIVSEADKLAIRGAQVEMLQAQAAFVQAQQRLLTTINEAYAHAGVTQADFGMNDKLEFVAVGKPAATPAPPKAAAPSAQPPK